MKQVWILFRTQMKASYGLRAMLNRDTSKKTSALGAAVICLALLMGLGSIVFVYCMVFSSVLDAALAMQYEELALDLAVMLVMALIAVLGIFIVLNGVFLAKDTSLLGALPVEGRYVFLSKFLTVYIFELVFTALIMVPILIIYACKVPETGVWFFVRGAYMILLMPILPLLVSSLLAGLLLLVVGRLRNRNRVTTLLSFALMVGMLVGQFLLQSKMMSMEAGSGDPLKQWFGENWSKLNSMIYPPMSWCALGIYGGKISAAIGLIAYTLTTIFAFVAVYGFCGWVYRITARRATESGTRNRKVSRDALGAKPVHVVLAVFRNEWRRILRSTVYVTNSLMGAIISVLVIFAPLALPDMGEAVALLQELNPFMVLVIIGALACGLMSTMNMGAFTVLSREGRALTLLQALPIHREQILTGKILFGVSLNLTWDIPLCLAVIIWGNLPLWQIPVLLILSLTLSLLVTFIGMLFDFYNPKLNWVNEAEAIKQNTNGALGMMVGFASLLAVGALGYVAMAYAGMPVWLMCLAIGVLCLGLVILLYRCLLSLGCRRLSMDL